MDLFFYLIGSLFLGLLPVGRVLAWTHVGVQTVSAKMDQTVVYAWVSRRPILFLFEQFLDFLKGYGVLWMGAYWFGESYWVVLAMVLALVCHVWSPFLKVPGRFNLYAVLLGIYCYLFWGLAIVCPLLYVMMVFLANSLVLGMLGTLAVLFGVFWYFELPLLFLPIHVCVCLIGLLVISPQLFQHLEGTPSTLLRAFRLRRTR